MAITRFKNSTIGNKTPKYNDVLAGLPFRPIIGTATDGGNGTTVSVAFTGNNPAGAGITYTALSTPGSLTATGPTSPITVSGLTSGTAYTFQVKAGNSLGDSAYSAASNSVTPVTPTSFDSIASANPSSAVASFTSIPSTYQHLQLRIFSRGGSTGIRFNSDSGTNYTARGLRGDGTTANSYAAWYEDYASVSFSGNSTYPSCTIVDILDYASTTKYKTVRTMFGFNSNGVFVPYVIFGSSLWLSTSAINRIDTAGSVTASIALYGIKGA